MTEEKQYVPAEQAIKLLGEKPAKFYYHVDRDEIATETPAKPGKGKKNNRYLVSDILKVKQRLQEQRRKQRPEVITDWLYAEDVPAGLKLSMLVYPGWVPLAEAAVYQGWRKNNPYLTMAAFSPDRETCYATIQVVPLPEQVILDVLSGKRKEESIDPDEIRSYSEPGPYTLLVASATCHPDMPHLIRRVLSKYMEYWVEQYPDRYIKKIYAQAESENGMKLIQHFFMMPRFDIAHNAFMLDMSYPSPSTILQRFKAQLEARAPLPPDLQWSPKI